MTWGSQQRQGQPADHHADARVLQHVREQVVAPLFPAPPLIDYGLLPELAGFGAMAVIVVAATQGRLSFHDERRPQESKPAGMPP
ncbi:hypothetical protein [Mycolicibacterium sp.]|uniref:hypothetical protein n=1 Tax=Mycolicibacterium sp. TaxID=2320850 RepID=UPI003D137B17